MIDIYFLTQRLLQEALSGTVPIMAGGSNRVFKQPGAAPGSVNRNGRLYLQPGTVDVDEGSTLQKAYNPEDIPEGVGIGILEALGDEDIGMCSIGYYVTVTLGVKSSETDSITDARYWLRARRDMSLISDMPNVPKPQGFIGYDFYESGDASQVAPLHTPCEIKPSDYKLEEKDFASVRVAIISPTGQEGYDRQDNFHVFYRTFLVGIELED